VTRQASTGPRETSGLSIPLGSDRLVGRCRSPGEQGRWRRSAAWADISLTSGAGPVHLIGAGPEDGFWGYIVEGGDGTARWGDYSAAVADEHGDIWVAAENTSATRTLFANWGTFLTRIDR
jgi:hypothetical protein